MRIVHVIKFGHAFCPQTREAEEALKDIQRTVQSRRPGSANGTITRRLRERGFTVLTQTSARSGPMFGRISAPQWRSS